MTLVIKRILSEKLQPNLNIVQQMNFAVHIWTVLQRVGTVGVCSMNDCRNINFDIKASIWEITSLTWKALPAPY